MIAFALTYLLVTESRWLSNSISNERKLDNMPSENNKVITDLITNILTMENPNKTEIQEKYDYRKNVTYFQKNQ